MTIETRSSKSLESMGIKTTPSKHGEKETLWNAGSAVDYAEKQLEIKLDPWQRDYINTKGNVAVRAGRQSGKSFAQSLRVALFALLNEKTQTLIIGAVDRQSVELFEKVKSHIFVLAKHMIKKKPTLHKVELRNGSKIIALPAGRTGYGLRNYTIHKLVADEAHYIPEEVWTAVRPMLATTGGTMDILSTPRGNVGFFYEAFQKGSDFTTFHTTTAKCPRIDEDFLKLEKKRMTNLQFMQEYEAEFLDSLQQFFTKELIDSCILPPKTSLSPSSLFHGAGDYYLGIDLAGYGGDENAYVVMEMFDNDYCKVKSVETTQKVSAVNTVEKILDLDRTWDFQKIYLDDGGIGTPILDFLIRNDAVKRKAEGINNASRSILANKTKARRILKEDLYGNLKLLMERGMIQIPNDENLIMSLLSIQVEIDPVTQNVKIFGKYSHITEGLIRAAWATKTKGLKLWIH